MTENKLKHLEMIQNVISRMNTNSFQIKGFCITMIAALTALYTNQGFKWIMATSYIVIAISWILDAYYLGLERKYRKVYKNILGFENDLKVREMDMSVENVTGIETSAFKALGAVPNLITYLLLIVFVSIIISNKIDLGSNETSYLIDTFKTHLI